MMGNFYNFGWGGMFGFGGIFMLVFWGLVIWGIMALIQGAIPGGGNERKDEDKALAVLKERYAKGDISRKEFVGKKEDLMK